MLQTRRKPKLVDVNRLFDLEGFEEAIDTTGSPLFILALLRMVVCIGLAMRTGSVVVWLVRVDGCMHGQRLAVWVLWWSATCVISTVAGVVFVAARSPKASILRRQHASPPIPPPHLAKTDALTHIHHSCREHLLLTASPLHTTAHISYTQQQVSPSHNPCPSVADKPTGSHRPTSLYVLGKTVYNERVKRHGPASE